MDLTAGTYVENEITYIGVKVLPSTTTNTRNFHLVLVIDTSGSMEGIRIDSVKRTLQLLVNNLDENNRLSLITYSDESRLVWNSKIILNSSRDEMYRDIDNLMANGGTNLEAGFIQIQISNLYSVDGVFVLTDGHINRGLSSSSALVRLIKGIVPPGTPVSTLGYGSEHNAMLLRDIATNTCGSYTYADAEEMIPTIIGDIVGGLSTTVGTNAYIEIPEGWTLHESGEPIHNKYYIGSLYSEKPQWVVFRANTRTPIPAQIQLFFNIQNNQRRLSISNYSTENIDDILIQKFRCDVSRCILQAIDQLRTNNVTAKQTLQNCLHTLESSRVNNHIMVIQMISRITEMIDSIPTHSNLTHGMPAMPAGLNRMVSAATVLQTQSGYMSADPQNNVSLFSSPRMIRDTTALVSQYSQT